MPLLGIEPGIIIGLLSSVGMAPALNVAVGLLDFEMTHFLVEECDADPSIIRDNEKIDDIFVIFWDGEVSGKYLVEC